MHGISNCNEYFDFILYADYTNQIPVVSKIDINNELAKVYTCLAVNM